MDIFISKIILAIDEIDIAKVLVLNARRLLVFFVCFVLFAFLCVCVGGGGGVLKLSSTNIYAFHEGFVTSLQMHICLVKFFAAMIKSGYDFIQSGFGPISSLAEQKNNQRGGNTE